MAKRKVLEAQLDMADPDYKIASASLTDKPSASNPSTFKNVLSRRRFAFRPDKLTSWKVHPRNPVDNRQREILTLLWNHVRAGSMDGSPLRILERYFAEIAKKQDSNKTPQLPTAKVVSDVIPFEIHTAEVETSVQEYDHDIYVLHSFYEKKMFPSYFSKMTRWNDLYAGLNSGMIWPEFLAKHFGKEKCTKGNLKGAHIIGRSKLDPTMAEEVQGNRLLIFSNLSTDIFTELFNYGFVRYVKIDALSPIMLRRIQALKEFAEFLWKTKEYRVWNKEHVPWIKIQSACPYFTKKAAEWVNIAQALKERPCIHPSVHHVQEIKVVKLEKWLQQVAKEEMKALSGNARYNNEWERKRSLRVVERMCQHNNEYYCWKDAGTISCKALNYGWRDTLSHNFASGQVCPTDFPVWKMPAPKSEDACTEISTHHRAGIEALMAKRKVLQAQLEMADLDYKIASANLTDKPSASNPSTLKEVLQTEQPKITRAQKLVPMNSGTKAERRADPS